MNAVALKSIFPSAAMVCIASPEMYYAPLFDDEIEYIRAAVYSRRCEYSAGRAAARGAMRLLGFGPESVLTNLDRSPRWPSGVVGSITHCRGFCGAVVGLASEFLSLGLDAEPIAELDQDVLPLIYSVHERSQVAMLSARVALPWARVGFCAKEAFYKCYFPVYQCFLDFLDVEVELIPSDRPEQGCFRVCLNSPASAGQFFREGRFIVSGGVICASMCFFNECSTATSR